MKANIDKVPDNEKEYVLNLSYVYWHFHKGLAGGNKEKTETNSEEKRKKKKEPDCMNASSHARSLVYSKVPSSLQSSQMQVKKGLDRHRE